MHTLAVPAAGTSGSPRPVEAIVAMLEDARERTLRLIAPLSDEDLRLQHDPLMGPILWDLGHIAQFEALWLLHNIEGPISFGEMPGMFNPFENPRRVRGELPLPSRDETLATLADVRRKVLERLASEAHSTDAGSPLRQQGYVYAMVAQHEHQHNETMLQTLQLKQGAPYAAPRGWELPARAVRVEKGAMAYWPGGEVRIGTDDRSAAYDNERPAHVVSLAPFRIDVAPVSNGDYAAFIAGGGYQRRELWSSAGWAWLREAAVEAPKHWERRDGEWWVRTMDRTLPLDPDRPVCHVCWYEAEAFANHAGKRLPTELEWEAAATADPHGGTRAFPWGDAPVTRELANVDQLGFGVAPIGAYPRNVSPIGCHGMIGDAWEWTSSDFTPYVGFEPFPYPEYSVPFFGSAYKVLRGGSWATRPGTLRSTFRNWDYPIRRQIFAGFRCAADA